MNSGAGLASGWVRLSGRALAFDNQVLRALPVDSSGERAPRTVADACWATVDPTPVEQPRILAWSPDALELIGVQAGQELSTEESAAAFASAFSGSSPIRDSRPAAHTYCGHQFGYFSGQLGDGATMYVGEVLNEDDGSRWELQFKGAGTTPFSRTADGRKVLRSSLREFVCSEAMHHLGIPTTRAGTLITSDSTVVRDVLYDGNPENERCTVITRIAPSFLRFGSFEIFKSRDPTTGREGPSAGNTDLLRTLTHFTISTYFPELSAAHEGLSEQELVGAFLEEVTRRTARLVAAWQSVAWCHGVLNTDNMSILGLTIDYGPYGWMEHYDPEYVCNGSDDGARYAYARQPEMCRWNCMRLADALAPLMVDADGDLAGGVDRGAAIVERVFDAEFRTAYLTRMAQKLGLSDLAATDPDTVEALVTQLVDGVMQEARTDWTNAFRLLSSLEASEAPATFTRVSREQFLDQIVELSESVESMRAALEPKIPESQLRVILQLAATQPHMIRHIPESLILGELRKLEKRNSLDTSSDEHRRAHHRELWSDWLDAYAAAIDASVPGDDPDFDRTAWDHQRRLQMDEVNPAFVLRNHVAQTMIDAVKEWLETDEGTTHTASSDTQTSFVPEMDRIMRAVQNPCAQPPPCDDPDAGLFQPVGPDAGRLVVT